MSAVSSRLAWLSASTLALLAFVPAIGMSQELSPRAFWPAPKGTNVLVLAYQHSSGDVLTDPSLPVAGVESKINVGQVTYQRTLSLFNRTSNIQFNLPYVGSKSDGQVQGLPHTRELAGLGDAQMVLSVNLRGAPSMDRDAFQALRQNPRTIIGASISVVMPTGAYEDDKLINAGSNRWATKTTVGVIWPVRPTWLVEVYVAAAFFGENDAFLGSKRQQNPVRAAELHLVKEIRPGYWTSLDWTYYEGGQTSVDGLSGNDLQRNSRIGATVVHPLKPKHAIRASVSTGLNVTSGGDYNSLILSYAYLW